MSLTEIVSEIHGPIDVEDKPGWNCNQILSSLIALMLFISLSYALGCVLIAAFHINTFNCCPANFFLKFE